MSKFICKLHGDTFYCKFTQNVALKRKRTRNLILSWLLPYSKSMMDGAWAENSKIRFLSIALGETQHSFGPLVTQVVGYNYYVHITQASENENKNR